MTFDRRFGNSYSLRYLVEGCGMRALYGEDCTHMDACRYVLASRTSLDGLEPALPTPVPDTQTETHAQPEPAAAQAACRRSYRVKPMLCFLSS